MQQIAVILIVAACLAWLGVYAWRFFHPKPGKICGGSCCDQSKKPAQPAETAQAAGEGQTVFFRSDDLVARVKARKPS